MSGEQVDKAEKVERELEQIERFRRVAGHRANRALDYLETLLKTADRSRYMYSEKQVTEIVGKLRQAVDQLEAAYSAKGGKRLRIDL